MDILWRDLLLVYNYRLSEVMTVSPGELTGTKGEHHETVKTTVNMTKRTQYKRPRRGRAAPAQGAGRPEPDATPHVDTSFIPLTAPENIYNCILTCIIADKLTFDIKSLAFTIFFHMYAK